LAGREFEEQEMEPDDRTALKCRITTSRRFSTELGALSRVAISEGEARNANGWLR
jgi:hypothetical protein